MHSQAAQLFQSFLKYLEFIPTNFKKVISSKMPSLTKCQSSQNEVPEYLRDFPPGPLDIYRAQASFDWKAMRLNFEKEAVLKFKVKNFCMIYLEM